MENQIKKLENQIKKLEKELNELKSIVYINSADAANILNVSKTSVFRFVNTGQLKTIYTQKQFSLFDKKEVERFLIKMSQTK